VSFPAAAGRRTTCCTRRFLQPARGALPGLCRRPHPDEVCVYWIVLLLAVVLNALANVLIKAGVNRLGASGLAVLPAALGEPMLYAGVLAFAFALIAYAVALSRIDLSVAYPLMTSLGLLIVAVASWRWFGETYDARKIAGTLLILAGVFLLTWYEHER
jgi:multidrug transporter EmrE-like cation transporter